jgi:hypothetical protein
VHGSGEVHHHHLKQEQAVIDNYTSTIVATPLFDKDLMLLTDKDLMLLTDSFHLNSMGAMLCLLSASCLMP